MKLIQSPTEMAARAAELRAQGRLVALAPCLGAIHAGKEAVIRAAAAGGRAAVVALFANPLQLGPGEPVSRYNSRREADLARCEEAGADTVFAPTVEDVYPPGYGSYVTEETISKRLCGVSRPNHFRGVTTFTSYLFNLIRPDAICIGQKTLQRAAVIRRMNQELKIGVAVEVVPTVRDPDGMAAGTVNEHMTATLRQSALAVSQALMKMKEMVAGGVTIPDRLVAEATHIMSQQRRARMIYVAVVDPTTMEPVRETTPGRGVAVASAWLDEMRLVDNVLL